MKKLITLLAIACYAINAQAQTCKVKIYYDANGNRIQRVVECPHEITPPNQVELQPIKKKMDGLGLTSGMYQVYPNPAENKVNIKLDANLLSKGCSIVMTDITGKVLYQQHNISTSVSAIDLQGYTDGAYLIVIVQGTDRHTVKIVKQTGNGY
jgi:hypothetical protein